MASPRYLPSALTIAIVLLLSACSAAPPPSPESLARCTRLYGLWLRYEQHLTFHHTGQRARAELALDSCQHGLYEPAMGELERMLRRGGFTRF